jgi:hypothetical protein
MTADRLVLQVTSPADGQRTVTVLSDRVRQVSVFGDPIRNGAAVGLATGALGPVGHYTVWEHTAASPIVHALLLGSLGGGGSARGCRVQSRGRRLSCIRGDCPHCSAAGGHDSTRNPLVTDTVDERSAVMIRFFAVLGFIMSTALVAHAQRVASFPDLPMRLNLGDEVTVGEIGGATSHGRLTEITPERLTLRMDSRDVVITRERVREVRACCDSLGNGTLIGLVAGATLGALVARGFSDHPGR